jgi:hypothetical protein
MDIVNPATPNLQHSSLIVISGLHRTAECYDSLNINRTQRIQEKLPRVFVWLSHELGEKLVPSEWKMRFRVTHFQPGNSMDCIFHVCTLAACIMYDWLLNYQVLNVNGTNMVSHTMRYEKKRVAAEPLSGGFHGFGYNFPDHYPDVPYDRLGYYLVWDIVIRALPDHMRRRQARLLNMTKAQITTFCEQQAGIGVGPNSPPTGRSW